MISRTRVVLLVVLAGAACARNQGTATIDGAVDGPPPAGTCVVVRDLQARSTAYVGNPSRLSDGFAYVPDSTQPMFEWLLLDEAGTSRQTHVDAPFFPYLRPTSVGTVREPRLLLFDRLTDPTGTQIVVQGMRPDGTTLGPAMPVLSVFDRGTAIYPIAVALDGHRTAVGNGHVGTRDPHFILLDDDGRPVGPEVRLMDTGDDPLFRCFTLTGTAHGVVAGVLDDGADVFLMTQLDADAHIVNQASLHLFDGVCPTIRAFGDGVDVSFTVTAGVRAGAAVVMRISSGAFQPVATIPPPEADSAYAWAAPGSEPLIAITRPDGVSFARLRGGALVPLAGAFPRGMLVPSPDGRIFLSRQDTNFDVSPPETTVSVVEVACAESPAPAAP